MKKHILFVALFCVSLSAFTQSMTERSVVQAELLRKSKRQHSTASILLGGGGTLLVTGILLFPKDYSIIFSNTPKQESQARLAGIMVITGTLSTFASLPLFFAAAHNKRRAATMELGLKLETAPVPHQSSFTQSSYPSLSLKIRL